MVSVDLGRLLSFIFPSQKHAWDTPRNVVLAPAADSGTVVMDSWNLNDFKRLLGLLNDSYRCQPRAYCDT